MSALSAVAATLRRRSVALGLLAVATVVAGVSRRAGWSLPRLPDVPLAVAGLAIVALAVLRLAEHRAIARRREAEARAVREAARSLPELARAWLDAGADADTPEADELVRLVVRRHEAIAAAAEALRAGREPADDETVRERTTTLERGAHRGEGLLTALAGLQREALVEAHRRGWLTSDRAMALEQRLQRVASAPAAATARPDALSAVTHAATAIYAALLPLDACQRLTTVAVAAGVGLLLVIVDGLASE